MPRIVTLALGVLLAASAGLAIAVDGGGGRVPSASLEPATRASCPEGWRSFAPPVVERGEVRRFSDDEFQRLVDLASDSGIIETSPPAILGDARADSRIRSIAEARGYRRRTDVGPAGLTWTSGRQLDSRAATAWSAMVRAARADGVALTLHSGYRSTARQRQIFLAKLRVFGHGVANVRSGRADSAIEVILRLSSIPGYSRHHTGLTIDILSPGFSTANFAASRAFRWLSDDNYRNAKSHGFVPSYPPDAGVQGPNPEPWEYVYVGRDALLESTDLASLEIVTTADGHVVARGVAAAADDTLTLYEDETPIAEVTGRCSPGGPAPKTPGEFRLEGAVADRADVCVVQRGGGGTRLVGCRE